MNLPFAPEDAVALKNALWVARGQPYLCGVTKLCCVGVKKILYARLKEAGLSSAFLVPHATADCVKNTLAASAGSFSLFRPCALGFMSEASLHVFPSRAAFCTSAVGFS